VHFGDQLTFVRPTFVIGSHERHASLPVLGRAAPPRGQYRRFPDHADNALQYIDARDLANSSSRSPPTSNLGAFHVARVLPPGRFFDVMQTIASKYRHPTLAWSNFARHIKSHHLDTRFPLWSGSNSETALAVNPAKAIGGRTEVFGTSVRAWTT